jgi:hypothetical protein
MIVKPRKTRRRVIDLDGPDGNAWSLLGYARRFAQQLGFSEATCNTITDEMRSGDYRHLVETFDRHFGSIIDLSWSQK